MSTYEEYANLRDSVRTYGSKWVQTHFEGRRDQALLRGEQDEADRWEAGRQSARKYVARRRLRHNFFSLLAGAGLAILPAEYVWLEGQEAIPTVLTFLALTPILALAIRFIDRLIYWLGCVLLVSAIPLLGWQLFIWLRDAQWPELSVMDALAWIGLKPIFFSIEGWSGASNIANFVYAWILGLSLSAGCLCLGLIFFSIAILTERPEIK